MEDWKNRLAEEYKQTKERYEKLKAYNNKKEIERQLDRCHCPPEQRIDDELRHDQQRAMGEYLHWLELRAELHGITL